jgi:hypothetical protein
VVVVISLDPDASADASADVVYGKVVAICKGALSCRPMRKGALAKFGSEIAKLSAGGGDGGEGGGAFQAEAALDQDPIAAEAALDETESNTSGSPPSTPASPTMDESAMVVPFTILYGEEEFMAELNVAEHATIGR